VDKKLDTENGKDPQSAKWIKFSNCYKTNKYSKKTYCTPLVHNVLLSALVILVLVPIDVIIYCFFVLRLIFLIKQFLMVILSSFLFSKKLVRKG